MAPEPPYYAVIFTSQRTAIDTGYEQTDRHMVDLVHKQPGFLGVESVSDASGRDITVSYWRSVDDIAQWRRHAAHARAQAQGRETWYCSYSVRVAKVERDHSWPPGQTVVGERSHRANTRL